MPNVSKISIALTQELAELVRQAVASGEYAADSEVIREALREWKVRRHLKQHEREELQRLWAEGLASGPGRLGGMRAIKQEARRRLASDAVSERNEDRWRGTISPLVPKRTWSKSGSISPATTPKLRIASSMKLNAPLSG
jgi:antitoxin ParD1/3/4